MSPQEWEVARHTWAYLDITAFGRQEEWEDSPEGYPQTKPYEWWLWHDEYGDAPTPGEWMEQVSRGLEQIRRTSSKGADAK